MFYAVAKERNGMAKKSKTTTFLVELPLVVEAGPARRVRAHLEVARQFYNSMLSEGLRRLRRMQADPSGKPLAPSPIPRNRPAVLRLRRCGSSMASPNTPCMPVPKQHG